MKLTCGTFNATLKHDNTQIGVTFIICFIWLYIIVLDEIWVEILGGWAEFSLEGATASWGKGQQPALEGNAPLKGPNSASESNSLNIGRNLAWDGNVPEPLPPRGPNYASAYRSVFINKT